MAMTGLEFLEGMAGGTIPHPPIAEIFSYRLTEVSTGRVTFRGRAEPQFANPMGTMHGGWYGTLLDSAMACAVMTRTAKGQQFTTLEYKVNLTRPFPAGAIAAATGTAIHSGRRTAAAEAVLKDEEGRVFAFSTTTCMFI